MPINVTETLNTQIKSLAKKQAELAVFKITEEEEVDLRKKAQKLKPSPVLKKPSSIDELVEMHEIPQEIIKLFWLAENVTLSPEEEEAIRYSLKHGFLSKREGAKNKQAYIRIDCFGADVKSPCVLEIWPGGCYSPIHEHAGATGIIKGLVGRVDVMLYEQKLLEPALKKVGMLTLSKGDTGWLSQSYGKQLYQIHQVYCPMAEDDYAATFHIYINWQKETFSYCENNEENSNCQQKEFVTVSHYHWHDLKSILMEETPLLKADKFCSNCGQKIYHHDRFCTRCGHKVLRF